MNEVRKSLGAGALVLLPIACCIGLPFLVAAGIGAAAFVWGGAIVGGLVLVSAVALLLARRRARAAACRGMPISATRAVGPVSEQREEVVQR